MKSIFLESAPSLFEISSADQEILQMDHLIQEFMDAGIPLKPVTIVNLYVSLKSKPIAILVGPQNSGKENFIKHSRTSSFVTMIFLDTNS